jgi:hypothetical protein
MPRRAKLNTVLRPIPRLPPVTIAMLVVVAMAVFSVGMVCSRL